MPSPPSISELRRAKFARRLPSELAALVGPIQGIVNLP